MREEKKRVLRDFTSSEASLRGKWILKSLVVLNKVKAMRTKVVDDLGGN